MWVICCCCILPNIDASKQEKRRGVFMAEQHVGHLFHIQMSSYMKTLVIRFVVVMPFLFLLPNMSVGLSSFICHTAVVRVIPHSLICLPLSSLYPNPPAINYQKQNTGCERVGLY